MAIAAPAPALAKKFCSTPTKVILYDVRIPNPHFRTSLLLVNKF
jgi:hypothetical protein